MKKYFLKYRGYHCLMFFVFIIQYPVLSQTLTLPQSIELAYKNNQLLKISSLETEGQQLLVKTARELPKTNFDVQLGRTQAAYTNDYVVGIVQQFSHPKYYQANADLQRSHVEATRRNMSIRKNEIAGTVKQIYYQILYYQQLRQMLIQQDSLYRSTLKAAEARYKTGESNLLEKVNAEVRLREIINRLEILNTDEGIAYQQLKTLLNIEKSFQIDLLLPIRKDTTLISKELSLVNNPTLSLYEQQTIIGKQQTMLEKQKLKPDFRVGIINQSIEHNFNQMAVTAGIGIPIFNQAQKARIEAAKVNEKISVSNWQYIENQLKSDIIILKKAYQKYQQSLNYYEKFALPQANLIIRNATTSYQNGEIEYLEFIQNSQQSWQIKEMYLSTILNLNQTIIQIETLLGIE